MRSFAAAVVAVAAISLLLAGAAMPGTVAAQPTTKAQFAKEMNSLCARTNASANAIGQEQTMAQVASRGPRFVALEQGFLNQLGTLRPPAVIKPHFSRFVSVVKQQLGLLKPVVAAARSNNVAAFQKAAAAAGYETQSEQAALGFEARVIGAPACATA
jgi:hypothetical protein